MFKLGILTNCNCNIIMQLNAFEILPYYLHGTAFTGNIGSGTYTNCNINIQYFQEKILKMC